MILWVRSTGRSHMKWFLTVLFSFAAGAAMTFALMSTRQEAVIEARVAERVAEESQALAETTDPQSRSLSIERSETASTAASEGLTSEGAVNGRNPAIGGPGAANARRTTIVTRTIGAGGTGAPASSNSEADATSSDPDGRDTAPINPIPLIDGLELDGNLADAHRRLERETADNAWAPYMEQQLLAYYGSKLQLSQEFSLPIVVCRQTMCEVQAIGYGEMPMQTWMSQTADFRNQPFAAEFSNVGVGVMGVGPDAQAVILILTRGQAMLGTETSTESN